MLYHFATPSHVVGFRLSGKLTEADIAEAYLTLSTALGVRDELGLVVDATQFDDVSSAEILDDLSRFDEIGGLSRFPRIAIVTEKMWLRALVASLKEAMPAVRMQVFGADEREAAIAFAAQVKEHERIGPSIKRLPSNAPHVFAYEIDGFVGAQEADELVTQLVHHFDQGLRMNVLGKVSSFEGFSPAFLLNGATISVKMAAVHRVDRYAIVGAPRWLADLVNSFDPVLAVDLRTFPASEEAAAWSWVAAPSSDSAAPA